MAYLKGWLIVVDQYLSLLEKKWPSLPTWPKIILMIVLSTVFNLVGIQFFHLGVSAFFFLSGLLNTVLWDEKHQWEFRFSVAMTTMTITGLVFYFLLPFKFGELINTSMVVVGVVGLLLFFGMGAIIGIICFQSRSKRLKQKKLL